MFSGLTGSGKSTLINCLVGCTLRRVTEQEIAEFCLDDICLMVKGKAEGGKMDSVTKIGQDNNKSETEVWYHTVKMFVYQTLPKKSFMHIDCIT
jgi:hypothetical protein